MSFESGLARVRYDAARTTPAKIAAAIGLTGFRAVLQPAPGPTGALVSLDESLAPLVADFNAARGRPRFLTILSPTCDECAHGAAAVREALLNDASTPRLDIFIVWSPMLPADSEAHARRAATRFKDARVKQYYDPQRRAGLAFRRDLFPDAVAKMRASLPKGHALTKPFESRDPALAEWDIYLFFGPAAEWTEKPPTPARFVRQVVRLDARTSVLWKNDYAQPPFEASLADELRAQARALLEK